MFLNVLAVLTVVMFAQGQTLPTLGERPDPLSPFTELARALGLPSQPDDVGNAVREIRLTDSYPNWAGARVPLLRLVDTGEGFRAELYVWWPKHHTPPMPTSGSGIRCGEGSTLSVVCVQAVEIPLQHDWNALAGRLLRLEDCRPKRPVDVTGSGGIPGGIISGVTDSGDLRMEIFDRGSYRTYKCNAPKLGSPQRPVGAEAVEAYEFLWELVRTPPVNP